MPMARLHKHVGWRMRMSKKQEQGLRHVPMKPHIVTHGSLTMSEKDTIHTYGTSKINNFILFKSR